MRAAIEEFKYAEGQTHMDPSYKSHQTFFLGVQSFLLHFKLYFQFVSIKFCDFKLFDSLVTALLLLSQVYIFTGD